MLFNHLAGVFSFALAFSAFIPWLTVWFYSLKGVESFYGIIILVSGLWGVAIAFFQHLSGLVRGRTFIVLGAVTLVSEALYYRKIARYSQELNRIFELLTDVFGQNIGQKLAAVVGEPWVNFAKKLMEYWNVKVSLETYDFVGGGLILAACCSLVLVVLGLILEKNKILE